MIMDNQGLPVAEESADDLTTDACPSPPRQDSDNVEEDKVDQNARTDKVRAKIEKETFASPKIPQYNKGTNDIPTNAYASVINISNANGVHIGSNYNFVMKNQDNSKASRKNKNIAITASIKSLMQSEELVKTEHVSFIATHMDEGWRDTARALEYSDGQIGQFQEDYFRFGIKEVIYQFLLDWKQNQGEKATIGKLAKTLWESNQKDSLKRWSQHKF